MGLYDNEGHRKQISVRLTPFQLSKLENITMMFGITTQRLLSDMLEQFYVATIDVQSGRISTKDAIKMSMINLLDDYIHLREVKGLVPHTSTRPPLPHPYGSRE